MEKNDLEKLITKYLSGKGSMEENLEVERWYASFEKENGFTERLTPDERTALESKLLRRIDQEINLLETTRRGKAASFRPFKIFASRAESRTLYAYTYRVAAAFIGFAIMAVFVYQSFVDSSTVVYATAYGETLNITLPDSSIVTLNGNSTFSYQDTWDKQEAREVYLDGEAFFSVTQRNNQKFIVTISDKVSVEVLGTKFNVSKRKSGTRVVLNSGKILLNLKEAKPNEHIMMSPGDLVEFKENPKSYVKKKVDAEIYSAWRNNKLIFDNTTLGQVLIILEENYGLKSYYADRELLDQKVSGSIPAENIEVLLKNLSVAYEVNIVKKNGSIEITKSSDK